MTIFRRFSIICLAIFIIILSAFPCGLYSYAEIVDDDIVWQPLNSESELVDAFQAYCKSRDVTIEGSIADAVTTATTGAFNGICNTLGIDITLLQADIKKSVDSNGGIQYLFNTNGISAYNRIFAQFLQDNELEVGEAADTTIYSGSYFIDKEGNACLVTVTDMNGSAVANSSGNPTNINRYIYYGSPYMYTSSQLASMSGSGNNGVYFYAPNNTYTMYPNRYIDTVKGIVFNSTTDDKPSFVDISENGYVINSFPSIIRYNNKLWFGYVCFYYNSYRDKYYTSSYTIKQLYTNDYQSDVNVSITLNSNNNVINNNNYEGDTIINNYGEPSSPSTPVNPPSPDYSPAEDWDIDLPDLNVPNWILSGKENKFPFDIPFNVMYALTLLQAEPEAPHLEGTLDLGVYQWDYDLDLSQFDTVAIICRNMEFLAFLTGLMLMTRKLIWG